MIIWTILFSAAFLQGIFQLSLLIYGGKIPNLPSRIMLAMLIFLLLFNLEYLLFSSGLYRENPHFLGISSGFFFLVGPSLWFYSRSVLEVDFSLKKRYVLHLLLFVTYYLLSVPVFALGPAEKIAIIDDFLAGRTPITPVEYLLFILQLGHIGGYLLANGRFIRSRAALVDPRRLAWLRRLQFVFTIYVLLIILAYLYFIWVGYYRANPSFLFALSYSVIIYWLSANLFLKPSVVLHEIRIKYRNSVLDGEEQIKYVQLLEALFEKDRPHLEPSLKLQEVADLLQISPHRLSQIINQQYGLSFSDYVNAHRVEEFKRLAAKTDLRQRTLLSLAYEAGFNSKSNFNAVFKKLCGMTPSAFVKAQTGMN